MSSVQEPSMFGKSRKRRHSGGNQSLGPSPKSPRSSEANAQDISATSQMLEGGMMDESTTSLPDPSQEVEATDATLEVPGGSVTETKSPEQATLEPQVQATPTAEEEVAPIVTETVTPPVQSTGRWYFIYSFYSLLFS